MTIDEIISFVRGFDGALTLRPGPGDGSPELSWGDAFCYYAPEGAIPTATQPFATVVTKDYPGDEASRLHRPGAFRVNIHAGRAEFTRWTGHAPGEPAAPKAGGAEVDLSAADTVLAHPVYGGAGWLAVVNPGPGTEAATRALLRTAYRLARSRHDRRDRRDRRDRQAQHTRHAEPPAN
jgi:hypothetical protein